MKLKNNAKNPTHTLLGISPDGNIIDAQISKFPHALIAGATGSGKTVMINTILLTAMAVSHPDELKLLVIDPKGNEFGNYKGLPH
uniref:FtsK/SpoIIIE domain-containing protein n=1 Tax=Mycobacterium marinum TaxID=1781 RepID=UPI003564DEDF